MNFFQAIILGIVQALTEYLPVSSSAHIRIFGDLMLGSDPGAAFTAIIQIGTELAVILYFRHDIIRILGAWFGSLFGKEGKDFKSRMGAHNPDTQMGWFIILGTMPACCSSMRSKGHCVICGSPSPYLHCSACCCGWSTPVPSRSRP